MVPRGTVGITGRWAGKAERITGSGRGDARGLKAQLL